MSDHSWLRNPFSNISRLINKAKQPNVPMASTPYVPGVIEFPKTPSAPPLPNDTPIRNDSQGMPSRRFSLSEPNMVTVDDDIRVARFSRKAPLGLHATELGNSDSEPNSSSRSTPVYGVPRGNHIITSQPRGKNVSLKVDHGTQVERTSDDYNLARSKRELESEIPVSTSVNTEKSDRHMGYRPPPRYQVPSRNVVREGERFVTFEGMPSHIDRSMECSTIAGQKPFVNNTEQFPYGQHHSDLRSNHPSTFDPYKYKDVYYNPDEEIEKLWRKHINPESNRVGYQPRQPMTFTSKPPKFDGKDWEGYLLQFNSCVVANDWNDEQSVKYLASSLTGDAVYVLAQKPVRSWSFSELCDALEERYGLTNSAFVNRSKLRRITQKQGQSIQEVADEILKLVRCSFSGHVREHDKIAVDYFIDAMGDPELKRHLMQKEPGDIRTAVAIGKKFEEIQLATRTRAINPRVFATNEGRGVEQPQGGVEQAAKLQSLYEEINRLRLRQADLEHRLSQRGNMAQQELMHPNMGHHRGQAPREHPNYNHNGGRSGSNNPNWRRQNGQE